MSKALSSIERQNSIGHFQFKNADTVFHFLPIAFAHSRLIDSRRRLLIILAFLLAIFIAVKIIYHVRNPKSTAQTNMHPGKPDTVTSPRKDIAYTTIMVNMRDIVKNDSLFIARTGRIILINKKRMMTDTAIMDGQGKVFFYHIPIGDTVRIQTEYANSLLSIEDSFYVISKNSILFPRGIENTKMSWIRGVVYVGKVPLESVAVRMDTSGVLTDKTGQFRFYKVKKDSKYQVSFFKPGYSPYEVTLTAVPERVYKIHLVKLARPKS